MTEDSLAFFDEQFSSVFLNLVEHFTEEKPTVAENMPDSDRRVLASLIGIMHDQFHGTLTVRGESKAISELRQGGDASALVENLDWLCEFSNLLAGGLKIKLSKMGFLPTVTLPQAHHEREFVMTNKVRNLKYLNALWSRGGLQGTLTLTTNGELEFKADDSDACLEEGSMVMF